MVNQPTYLWRAKFMSGHKTLLFLSCYNFLMVHYSCRKKDSGSLAFGFALYDFGLVSYLRILRAKWRIGSTPITVNIFDDFTKKSRLVHVRKILVPYFFTKHHDPLLVVNPSLKQFSHRTFVFTVLFLVKDARKQEGPNSQRVWKCSVLRFVAKSALRKK